MEPAANIFQKGGVKACAHKTRFDQTQRYAATRASACTPRIEPTPALDAPIPTQTFAEFTLKRIWYIGVCSFRYEASAVVGLMA